MNDLDEQIQKLKASKQLPQHIAIIMDGNGRWAKHRGQPRPAGHLAGAAAVRRTVEAAPDLGITTLTLYAFSSENWKRPADEVQILSGMFEGRTTGTPIALVIENTDARSRDYENIKRQLRPGHADRIRRDGHFRRVDAGTRRNGAGGRTAAARTGGRFAPTPPFTDPPAATGGDDRFVRQAEIGVSQPDVDYLDDQAITIQAIPPSDGELRYRGCRAGTTSSRGISTS